MRSAAVLIDSAAINRELRKLSKAGEIAHALEAAIWQAPPLIKPFPRPFEQTNPIAVPAAAAKSA